MLGAKLGWVLIFGGRMVGISCGIVLLALVSMRHFAEPVRRGLVAAARSLPQRWAPRVEKTLNALVKGVESTRSDAALVLILLYSIMEWVLIAACYWCLARAYDGVINITFVDVLIMMAFVAFGGVIQIPASAAERRSWRSWS